MFCVASSLARWIFLSPSRTSSQSNFQSPLRLFANANSNKLIGKRSQFFHGEIRRGEIYMPDTFLWAILSGPWTVIFLWSPVPAAIVIGTSACSVLPRRAPQSTARLARQPKTHGSSVRGPEPVLASVVRRSWPINHIGVFRDWRSSTNRLRTLPVGRVLTIVVNPF